MAVVTFAYDGGYDPSAPVIEIGVGPADGAPARLTVLALVDSGADGTVLPEAMLQQVGARYVQRRMLRGITGDRVAVNLHLVAIHVRGQVIASIRAVADKSGNEAIIGRDVLNQLMMTLDGPAKTVTIHPSPPGPVG